MTHHRLLAGVEHEEQQTFHTFDAPQLTAQALQRIDSAEMLVAFNAGLYTVELHAVINNRATIGECFTLRIPQYYLRLRDHVIPKHRQDDSTQWAEITEDGIAYDLVSIDGALKHTSTYLHYVHYRAAPYGTDDRTMEKIYDHLTTLLTGNDVIDAENRPYNHLSDAQRRQIRNTADMILFDIHQPNVITEHQVLDVLDSYAEIFDDAGQYLRKMPELIRNTDKEYVNHWVSIPMGSSVPEADIVLPARVMHYGNTTA